MAGIGSLQSAIQAATGSIGLPGALNATLQSNAGLTTTATNITLVFNGIPQGLVKTLTIDEQINYQRVKALGSPVDIAFLPGVYEATGTINRAFLYNVGLEASAGGGIRPVQGTKLTSPDFTKFYFNIVESGVNGQPIAVRHDCVITSVRHTVEIDSVTIYEDASIMIRWSDVAGAVSAAALAA